MDEFSKNNCWDGLGNDMQSVKMMKKHGDASVFLYPIAVRMTKTLWSAGRSECNRVN